MKISQKEKNRIMNEIAEDKYMKEKLPKTGVGLAMKLKDDVDLIIINHIVEYLNGLGRPQLRIIYHLVREFKQLKDFKKLINENIHKRPKKRKKSIRRNN